ncbi:MAG: TolB family protein [Patescibacteria group bacterium]
METNTMDYKNYRRNTINKKHIFKIKYIFLILVVVIFVYLVIRYFSLLSAILNPKSLQSYNTKTVNLTNAYNLKGRLYFVKNNNLWEITGKKVKQVTYTNDVSDIAISKNGQKVAYIHFHTNFSNLYQMNINGTGITRVVNWRDPNINNELWSATPTYSPNGQYIAYLTNLEKIFTGVDIAGMGIFQISANKTYQSPDQQISGPNYYGETDLVNPNPFTGGDAGVTWPNSNFILYTSYIYWTANLAQPDSQIMLYDFQTGQSYPVTPLKSEAMQPRLSPNGKYLAFLERKGNNNANLYTMQFNLQNILTHTETSSFTTYKKTLQTVYVGMESHPTWSPSGNSLAFMTLSNNSFDIAVIKVTVNHKTNKLNFSDLQHVTRGSTLDSTSKMYWLN